MLHFYRFAQVLISFNLFKIYSKMPHPCHKKGYSLYINIVSSAYYKSINISRLITILAESFSRYGNFQTWRQISQAGCFRNDRFIFVTDSNILSAGKHPAQAGLSCIYIICGRVMAHSMADVLGNAVLSPWRLYGHMRQFHRTDGLLCACAHMDHNLVHQEICIQSWARQDIDGQGQGIYSYDFILHDCSALHRIL